MPIDDGKVSLRSVQHSLNRFKNSLPPLYIQLRSHVDIIKLAKKHADIRALNKEQIAASRTFKNLKHYLKELDELENRVFFSDLEKFKATADPLKQAAYDEIVKFVELDENLDKINRSDILANSTVSSPNALPHDHAGPSSSAPTSLDDSDIPCATLQLELDEPHPELMSLQERKDTENDLEQLEATAQSWNQLQQDIQDVAEIMTNLNRIVTTHGEEIHSIENNVEQSKIQTRMGLLEIIKARRAKFASVPVAGAVVGCMVGGPLGMIVGFKVAGVLTAAVGTYVGYKSGKFLRDKVNDGIEEEAIPGGLEARTIGAYEDGNEEEEEENDSFHQFDDSEIRMSEEYKGFR